VGRKILWASLALTPLVLLLRFVGHAGDTVLFVLAALALIPLAWVIGEATEHVAEHTGAGVGGFVNASFGNAPELIIALLAIEKGLPDVVRGSITGSVVSNLLLVLGAAVLVATEPRIDTRSLLVQLAIVLCATLLFLVPAIPSWHGDPERNSLYVVTLPVAVLLLGLYVAVTVANLRRHRAAHTDEASPAAWSLKQALIVLAAATVATAFVSEVLVGSLEAFGHALGLSDFVIATVIVAIVGNAAEHGGAVIVARRGNTDLAGEIAISSAAQVAVFVAPVIALLSWLPGDGLPLSFRPVEIGAMAASAILVWLVIRDGRAARREGAVLLGLYGLAVIGFAIAGDR
jgi:Ca2+:H+ antiporter